MFGDVAQEESKNSGNFVLWRRIRLFPLSEIDSEGMNCGLGIVGMIDTAKRSVSYVFIGPEMQGNYVGRGWKGPVRDLSMVARTSRSGLMSCRAALTFSFAPPRSFGRPDMLEWNDRRTDAAAFRRSFSHLKV